MENWRSFSILTSVQASHQWTLKKYYFNLPGRGGAKKFQRGVANTPLHFPKKNGQPSSVSLPKVVFLHGLSLLHGITHTGSVKQTIAIQKEGCETYQLILFCCCNDPVWMPCTACIALHWARSEAHLTRIISKVWMCVPTCK